MKVFLHEPIENECGALLGSLYRKAREPRHELVDSPDKADLILVTGSYSFEGLSKKLTQDPLVRQNVDRCVCYNDDDAYLPLLPGVYCSPRAGYSTKIGRVATYSYIVRHIQKGNPHVRPAAPDVEKDLLFSFQGRLGAKSRKRLIREFSGRSGVLVEDTTANSNWATNEKVRDYQKTYVETIHRSHFVLCPRGGGTGSFRFFETMQMGVAPVMISDGYVMPEGPDWSSFVITVGENDVERMVEILEPLKDQSRERGRLARLAWEQWFDIDKEFNEIVDRCAKVHERSNASEARYRAFWPLIVGRHYLKRGLRRNARAAVLGTANRLGVKIKTYRDVPQYDVKASIEKAKSL